MQIRWNMIPLGTLVAILFTFSLQAQNGTSTDSTGLPGDNFSLEGALELFKKAESLEGFEKSLNADDNDVNNLDLNEDGQIDYVRVIDRMDGDAHAIVLQVPINATEAQDVAVIEIEKDGTESATLQIVGDEDIYGREVIAEPYAEEATQTTGRHGPAPAVAPVYVVVNVWAWPAVRFIYRPAYVVYVSPWRWNAYPTWWRPAPPRPWGWYHARVRPYRVHYRVVPTHRVVRAHSVYSGHRTHSTVVHSRTVTHVSRNNGRHANGGNVQRDNRQHTTKTTKTTTVHGRRGGGSEVKQQARTNNNNKGQGKRRGRQ